MAARKQYLVPVVERGLMGGVASMGGFAPEKLRERLGSVVSVKRSVQKRFMYNEDGRGLDVGGEKFACEVVGMEPEALVEAMEGEGPPYHYATAPLSRRGLEAFPEWAELSKGKRGAYASVWLGGAGSTTQSHYDVADNVLGQAHGRKRVRIWAPGAHWAMRVFPDAHPRARKAQVDVDELDVEPCVDTILEPGDAVRIPAFWFHHCEALDASASLNVFAPSDAALAAGAFLAGSVPAFPGDFGTDPGLQDDFIPRLFESRYAPLKQLYRQAERSPEKDRPRVGSSSRPVAPAVPRRQRGEHDDHHGLEDDALRRRRLLDNARTCAGPAAADAVAELALAHLVELWAMHWHHHDAAQVCRFLERGTTAMPGPSAA